MNAPAPSPCVGRSAELEWLNRHLASALQGTGRVALLSAEAGAGKSTLSEHFLGRVAEDHPEVLVIRATCSEQYGGGEPYQPFVEAFRTLLTPGDEPERKRGIRAIAKELAPYWVAAIPVAGEVIAATMATASEFRRSFGSGEAGAQAPSEEALFFQYTKLFFAAADERPILLFIDDLHWADRASVSLLLHLARRIQESRVLILGTLRPVDVKVTDHPLQSAKLEMERYGVAEEMDLQPLPSENLPALAESVLGAPAEEDLLVWLERRAGTNTLFFVELLRWLTQNGHAVQHMDRWRLGARPDEVSIPRSAESTIEKRLGRLDEETFRILEYASVQGNEFLSTSLARLLDMDELEVEERLEPLERTHRLIRLVDTIDLPDGDIASLYSFSHSLVQDVLHSSLKGKRRVLLHRKTAEMLEEADAEGREAVAHKLAVHWDEGRVPAKAYEYSMQAAERASRVYAHWDAVELVLRAQRNAPDDAGRAHALQRLGEIQWLVGRLPEALEAMREALALREKEGAAVRVLELRRKTLLLERDQGSRPPREIAALLHRNAEETRALGAKEELCETLWHLVELAETDRIEDVELATEALALAAEIGEDRLLAKGHNALGLALMQAGDPAAGAVQFREALKRYEALEDLAGSGRCSNCLAISAIMQGDRDGALEEFERARSAFTKVGEPLPTALVMNNMGVVMTRTGRLDEAERLLNDAITIWHRLDARTEFLSPLQNLAELAQMREQWDEAERRWKEMRDQAFHVGSVDAAVIAECGLGHVALHRGEVASARSHLKVARDRSESRGAWTEAKEATQLLEAQVCSAEGDHATALALLKEAEEELRDRDRYMWATVATDRACILRRTGDDTEAEAVATEAETTFIELGATLMASRARAILDSKGEGEWSERSRAAS